MTGVSEADFVSNDAAYGIVEAAIARAVGTEPGRVSISHIVEDAATLKGEGWPDGESAPESMSDDVAEEHCVVHYKIILRKSETIEEIMHMHKTITEELLNAHIDTAITAHEHRIQEFKGASVALIAPLGTQAAATCEDLLLPDMCEAWLAKGVQYCKQQKGDQFCQKTCGFAPCPSLPPINSPTPAPTNLVRSSCLLSDQKAARGCMCPANQIDRNGKGGCCEKLLGNGEECHLNGDGADCRCNSTSMPCFIDAHSFSMYTAPLNQQRFKMTHFNFSCSNISSTLPACSSGCLGEGFQVNKSSTNKADKCCHSAFQSNRGCVLNGKDDDCRCLGQATVKFFTKPRCIVNVGEVYCPQECWDPKNQLAVADPKQRNCCSTEEFFGKGKACKLNHGANAKCTCHAASVPCQIPYNDTQMDGTYWTSSCGTFFNKACYDVCNEEKNWSCPHYCLGDYAGFKSSATLRKDACDPSSGVCCSIEDMPRSYGDQECCCDDCDFLGGAKCNGFTGDMCVVVRKQKSHGMKSCRVESWEFTVNSSSESALLHCKATDDEGVHFSQTLHNLKTGEEYITLRAVLPECGLSCQKNEMAMRCCDDFPCFLLGDRHHCDYKSCSKEPCQISHRINCATLNPECTNPYSNTSDTFNCCFSPNSPSTCFVNGEDDDCRCQSEGSVSHVPCILKNNEKTPAISIAPEMPDTCNRSHILPNGTAYPLTAHCPTPECDIICMSEKWLNGQCKTYNLWADAGMMSATILGFDFVGEQAYNLLFRSNKICPANIASGIVTSLARNPPWENYMKAAQIMGFSALMCSVALEVYLLSKCENSANWLATNEDIVQCISGEILVMGESAAVALYSGQKIFQKLHNGKNLFDYKKLRKKWGHTYSAKPENPLQEGARQIGASTENLRRPQRQRTEPEAVSRSKVRAGTEAVSNSEARSLRRNELLSEGGKMAVCTVIETVVLKKCEDECKSTKGACYIVCAGGSSGACFALLGALQRRLFSSYSKEDLCATKKKQQEETQEDGDELDADTATVESEANERSIEMTQRETAENDLSRSDGDNELSEAEEKYRNEEREEIHQKASKTQAEKEEAAREENAHADEMDTETGGISEEAEEFLGDLAAVEVRRLIYSSAAGV